MSAALQASCALLADPQRLARGPAPLLGQHNHEIALTLGHSQTDIDALVRDDVLCSEPYGR